MEIRILLYNQETGIARLVASQTGSAGPNVCNVLAAEQALPEAARRQELQLNRT
jgi:hypothetical protein